MLLPVLAAIAVTLAVSISSEARQPSEPHEVAIGAMTLDKETQTLEPVVVTGERPVAASSELLVPEKDFQVRPQGRPADILRIAPGLFIGQHAGGGKAEQYFLRGFDSDHGTDVGLFWDDVPINLRSHVHGQGYADAHFVIPETIKLIDVRKGPYHVEYGDFVTAGMVNFVTREITEDNFVSLAGGKFDTGRFLTMVSPTRAKVRTLLAAEAYLTDGPFQSAQNFRRYNILGKLTFNPTTRSELALTVTHYSGAWNASGQVPLREVLVGRLDRFGAIDTSEGGNTHRTVGNLRYRWDMSIHSALFFNTYVQRYDLDLFSNFTFFLNDPVNGDGIEQNDDRYVYGGDLGYQINCHAYGVEGFLKIGLQTRVDDGRVRLGTQIRRARTGTKTDMDLFEVSYSPYFKVDIQPFRRLRFIGGVRGDFFYYDVNDKLHPTGTGSATGNIHDARPSFKGNLVLGPWANTELFLNAGTGFHSNDARAVVAKAAIETLPKATSYEIGARSRQFNRLDIRASLWLLDLTSELVSAGDEGTTKIRGATRRYGAEVNTRLALTRWLHVVGDWALTHAEFRGTGAAVPLAPELTIRTDLIARLPWGLETTFEMRYLGDRPATEDRSARTQAYLIFDLIARYRYKQIGAFASIENIFNAQWRETQFFFESRLHHEADPVSDIHFTPGGPRSFLLGVTLYF
jgi:outer membrane receptor protein involved in Fe transport